jgi:oligopeptide transport system substrate-binding protein
MPVLAEPIRPQVQAEKQRSDSETTAPPVGVHLQREKPENEQAKTEKAGIEAVSDHVLKVTLVNADPDFPKLVANPIFRPVYGDGSDLAGGLNANIVTSGAFRIAGVGADGVVLERSDKYWNRDAVSLERVRIVPHDNAEAALEAYKSGEVDAVTNAEFAPLALKLLSPYEDFKQTTHNALNFYEFNILNPPYNDHRVREALSMAIERERLTEGEMKGSTTPATGFLPFDDQPHARIEQDAAKAKDLLAKAGFPDGEYFPTLKLVVNRNDTQQRIARSVAKMWKDNLNIDTEIIVKDPAAFEEAKASGDFDLIRRGLVFPTMDSTASFMAIFPPAEHEVSGHQPLPNENTSITEAEHARAKMPEAASEPLTLTEEDAVLNLLAIPLYYPTSYSLVKPYVQGFEVNGLDAPSLKEVAIDNDWQPGK